MCPRHAKKLMILSRFEYLIIFMPHRYRRTSTTVSSPCVRACMPQRCVPGVCNRHNTSRLVRGRQRKIWRHASPPRLPATAVDVRRAIRVEGIFRILLHHQKL